MDLLRLLGLAAVVALLGACSDEFVPPPSGGGGGAGTGGTGGSGATAGTGGGGSGSGGTAGVSGTGGTAGASGAGGMGGAGGIGGVGGVGTAGACVNEPDIGMTLPNLRWQAASCGESCAGLAHDAFVACVNPCVETEAPGLSPECTDCYGELAWCAGDVCNAWCATQTLNACTPECIASSVRCPAYSTCLTELDQCAGRDSLDCLDDT
jgi:hypothetical protein